MNWRMLLILTLCGLTLCLGACSKPNQIVIGSKNFTEQVILGELLAQQIERKTALTVDRRLRDHGRSGCGEQGGRRAEPRECGRAEKGETPAGRHRPRTAENAR